MIQPGCPLTPVARSLRPQFPHSKTDTNAFFQGAEGALRAADKQVREGDSGEGEGHWRRVSPAGAGPTARKAARPTASRASSRRWPASAAAQPSPGGAITTTAPVGPWVPRIEGGQREGLLSISQSREVRVGVSVPECGVWAPKKGRRVGERRRGVAAPAGKVPCAPPRGLRQVRGPL